MLIQESFQDVPTKAGGVNGSMRTYIYIYIFLFIIPCQNVDADADGEF